MDQPEIITKAPPNPQPVSDNIQSPASSPQSKYKLPKILTITLILIAISASGIAAYFFYQNQQLSQQIKVADSAIQSTTRPTPSPSTIEVTADSNNPYGDWVQYSNSDMGVGFKISPYDTVAITNDLEKVANVNHQSDSFTFINSSSFINPETLEICPQDFNSHTDYCLLDTWQEKPIEIFTLDGQIAINFYLLPPGKNSPILRIVQLESHTFSISRPVDGMGGQEDFDQILSTLTLKPEKIEGWNTYTNPDNTFQFQYPQELQLLNVNNDNLNNVDLASEIAGSPIEMSQDGIWINVERISQGDYYNIYQSLSDTHENETINQKGTTYTILKSLTINGQKAIKFTEKPEAFMETNSYLIYINSNIYRFRILPKFDTPTSEQLSTFDTLVTTFIEL